MKWRSVVSSPRLLSLKIRFVSSMRACIDIDFCTRKQYPNARSFRFSSSSPLLFNFPFSILFLLFMVWLYSARHFCCCCCWLLTIIEIHIINSLCNMQYAICFRSRFLLLLLFFFFSLAISHCAIFASNIECAFFFNCSVDCFVRMAIFR